MMNTETAMPVGSTVVARVTAQGMVSGRCYEVLSSSRRYVLGMGYTTLGLRLAYPNTGEARPTLSVGNPHLVLEVV